MATDIMDKSLGAARKERWNLAFNCDDPQGRTDDTYAINRKATIVIEHLIQVIAIHLYVLFVASL